MVKVMPFEPYPEGRILATLEALERPVVISVAETFAGMETRRTGGRLEGVLADNVGNERE
jgi:hypothetical protein